MLGGEVVAATAMARTFGANGILYLEFSIPSFWVTAIITGGPFQRCPRHMYGVCLLETEPDMAPPSPCHLWLPIADFSTPDDRDDVIVALKEVLLAVLNSRSVYVGCAGGFGRTGLFLALLAKVAGKVDPVAYVRKHYSERAVETRQQENYVRDFPVRGLRWWLFWQAIRRKLFR